METKKLTWGDIPEEIRERYLNQDKVHKDVRLRYANLSFIDSFSNENGDILRNSPLNEEDLLFIEKVNLTDKQKTCLYKSAWEGMKQKDIGEELGIVQQVVSHHIFAAKRKINKFLKKSVKANGKTR